MKKLLPFQFMLIVAMLFAFAAKSWGQTVFEKRLASSSPDEIGLFAGPGQSGSIVICGHTYTQPEDALIVRIDNNGTLQWAKKFGGTDSEWIYKVRPTSDGGYITCGYTMSTGAGMRDAMLVKLDAGGNISWARTYGTANNDYLVDVRQTSDGGYIATGSTNNTTNVTEGTILVVQEASTSFSFPAFHRRAHPSRLKR